MHSAPDVVIGGGGKLIPIERLMVDLPSLSRAPGSGPGPNVLPGAAALLLPLLLALPLLLLPLLLLDPALLSSATR